MRVAACTDSTPEQVTLSRPLLENEGSCQTTCDTAGQASNRTPEGLRQEILDLVVRYHAAKFPARKFQAGVAKVPVAGRVFDADEMVHLVDSSLDFWLTAGRFADQFERQFAR